MIRSSPLKAPDATNRMLVVSTCTVSPLNFLLFFSGTLTTVPSSSFSKPCRHTQTSTSTIITEITQYRKYNSARPFCCLWHSELLDSSVYPALGITGTTLWFVSYFTGQASEVTSATVGHRGTSRFSSWFASFLSIYTTLLGPFIKTHCFPSFLA